MLPPTKLVGKRVIVKGKGMIGRRIKKVPKKDVTGVMDRKKI